MILPTKNISTDRALLSVGAHILQTLRHPKTVSAVWNELSQADREHSIPRITYTWFILALDLLYMLGAIELKDGVLRRRTP